MKNWLLLTLVFASSVAQAHDYFSDVDRTIESESLTKLALVSERYYRVIARLSVYALYCDAANKLGYSARFHDTWVATADLQKEAEAAFGGFKTAYNKLEAERNELPWLRSRLESMVATAA